MVRLNSIAVFSSLAIACFLFAPVLVHAQFEFGIAAGASTYAGDLAPGFFVPAESRPAGSIFVKYNLSPGITLRGSVWGGTIGGRDTNQNIERLRERNLSFRSRVIEFSAGAEWNLLPYKPGSNKYFHTPYLFGCLAIYRHDPQARIDKDLDGDLDWVRLQPLGTEGQGTPRFNDREKYALTQVSIPFGAGYKYNFNRFFTIGIEVGARKTFTDYLDDVSTTYTEPGYLTANSGALAERLSNRTGEYFGGEPRPFTSADLRGNANRNDWYFMGGITFSYNLLGGPCFRFGR